MDALFGMCINMRAGTTMDKQKAIQDEFKNIGVVIDETDSDIPSHKF